MANDSLPPPIGGTSDDKESPSEIPNTTPALQWIKQPIAGLGLFLILIALPTVLKFNINPAAVVLICAGATLLILSGSLLRVRRHWAHFLMLYGSIGLIAACAAWLGWYYSFMPQDPVAAGSVAGFVMFPMLLLCGPVVSIASGACFVSAVVVLFVKTDSTGTLKEDGRKTMPRRIPQLVGVSLVGAALIILFVTVYPRASPDLLILDEIGVLSFLSRDADSVTITGCQKEASGKLVIPQAIEGRPVTRIGNYAFSTCSSLTSITIPDSVTSIGYEAFRDCEGLTSITIPDSVTSIGEGAFVECKSLTNITIPDSVTSIGAAAFQHCHSLTSITIPDSVTSIERQAFAYCIGLTSITIPDSITSIGGDTFSGCTSLTSITIPSSVISIGYEAFIGCSSLTSVTIGNGVTSIGDEAFGFCSSLTAVTFLGDAPKAARTVFSRGATPTIYRKPEAKGWGETWGGRPVKLISEKP